MDSQSAKSSRFNVIFGRSTGSRKQRSKREGRLSVGFHTSSLFDIDANACVMVCKGTGVAPNRIFTAMQAARRGAAWTVGTELALNGFEVIIEEVMELHLIPYSEDVCAGVATTELQAAAPLKQTYVNRGESVTGVLCNPRCTRGAFARSALSFPPAVAADAPALPDFLESSCIAPSSDSLSTGTGCDTIADHSASPIHTTTHEALSAAVHATAPNALHGKPRQGSLPSLRDEMAVVVAHAKRQRAEERGDAGAPTQGPRLRRSAASLACELRSSYPQYF